MLRKTYVQKILVVRYGTIGDAILASAFLRELRKSCEEAQIDVLVDCISYEVIKECSYINSIHKVNGKYRSLFRYIEMFRGYDTVYFLKNDNFFTKVAFLARVKNRIGFRLRRNFALTKKVNYEPDMHEIDCYLSMLDDYSNSMSEVWISDESRKSVQKILEDIKHKIVVIQATSRFKIKNWTDKNWVKIIKYLSDELNFQVVYLGSSNDDYSGINKSLSDVKIPPVNLCGQVSIKESMAIIEKATLYIGVDSGLGHVAAALDIPSISLMGPTSTKHWRPRSDKNTVISKFFKCSPCILQPKAKCRCKGIADCMQAITAEDVIYAISQKLDQHNSD